MQKFLGALANQLSSQYSIGNTNTNSISNLVGDLQYDQSAQRSYNEEGYLRNTAYSASPKVTNIIMQQPIATVLIKKNQFSSIAEGYNVAFMDANEKQFYKTMKVLFANKCNQISALEKLSKIQSVVANGNITDAVVPLIISLSDIISGGSTIFGNSPLGGNDAQALSSVTDQLRKIYAFNTTNFNTTWIQDTTNIFNSTLGTGTGVIELTNFTSFNTTTSVNSITQAGTFGLEITDPYEAMLITAWDIEKAIADATNLFNNSSTFQFAQNGTAQVISDTTAQLNQIRSARGASTITIQTNPSSLIGQRVTAILDSIGTAIPFTYDASSLGFSSSAVTVDPNYIKGGVLGGNGLSKDPSVATVNTLNSNQSELSLFQTLILNYFNKISMDANSQNTFQTSNKNTNYTRKKLNATFLGRLLIQPMDVVHFYINSSSMLDNKLSVGLNGFFNGLGLIQQQSILTSNINTLSQLFNSSAQAAEKAAFVGSDFPDSLWMMLRPQFVNEVEGTHVYAGVVENASESWNSGKFSVSIGGSDFTHYFDLGKVNFKPGVDSFNGAIFDPLTPFKTSFDTISTNANDNTRELLDENKIILGTASDKKSLLKAKSGPDAGRKVASDHFVSDQSIDPNTGNINRILYAPDGLVYKWKEGIGVFTQFGSSLDLNNPNLSGDPNIFVDPFAGQDVMNVISLLITGQPYNFATYWKATNTPNGFNRDQSSQQDSSHSYAAFLQGQLTKSNALWGNFIPFKNLVIDEQSFVLAQNHQVDITNGNDELNKKIQQLQVLNTQAQAANALNGLDKQLGNTIADTANVSGQIQQLRLDITNQIKALATAQQKFNAASVSSGPDASFQSSNFGATSANNPSDNSARQSLRKQINYLTRRLSYNVRANEDKNLFIVDDSYDKDLDIAAYNQELTELSMYSSASDYLKIREQIVHVADLLNLEVFADTQGHIRVRSAQYNRMPSSVFYNMIYMKQAYGVQIFPQFLDDLFTTQVDTLRKRIEILEDMIRLDCAIVIGSSVLEASVPTAQTDLISTNFLLSGATNNTGSSFSFISSPDDTITDVAKLLNSVDPTSSQALTGFIDGIQNQATSNKDPYNNAFKYTTIIYALTTQNLTSSGYPMSNVNFNNNSLVDQLISRIQTKSGQKINKSDYLQADPDNLNNLIVTSNAIKNVDVFKVTTELQQNVQDRQKLLKLFYTTLINAKEAKSLDNDPSVANQILSAGVFNNSNIPEIFEHLLEDESYNDFGGNSGSRYIIKREQIRQYKFEATQPDYNMVEVQGVMNPFAPNANPDGLNSFPGKGNGLTTAAAIDYDSWRTYGLKFGEPIKVPFLSDPSSQCAPYAAMLLSRSRKEVLHGSMTIVGNEYMQPGEVVFIEDKGLLFYVKSVQHSFSWGSSFTTTLELTYGHAPGDYIPTPMDMIGKLLYNNKDIAGYVIDRQSNSNNESNMGIIQMDPNMTSTLPNTSGSTNQNSTQSGYSKSNSNTMNNILFSAANIINSNNTVGNNITAVVELRIYNDNSNSVNSNLQNFANQARNILIGKNIGQTSLSGSQQFQNQPFPANSVNVVIVNLDDETDRKSPSQKAIDAARNTASSVNFGNAAVVQTAQLQSGDGDTVDPQKTLVSNDNIRAALFNFVVDCWLSFDTPPVQTNGGN